MTHESASQLCITAYRLFREMLLADLVQKLATGTALEDQVHVVIVFKHIVQLRNAQGALQPSQRGDLPLDVLQMLLLLLSREIGQVETLADGFAGAARACTLVLACVHCSEAAFADLFLQFVSSCQFVCVPALQWSLGCTFGGNVPYVDSPLCHIEVELLADFARGGSPRKYKTAIGPRVSVPSQLGSCCKNMLKNIQLEIVLVTTTMAGSSVGGLSQFASKVDVFRQPEQCGQTVCKWTITLCRLPAVFLLLLPRWPV